MTRKADPRLREELLARAVDYVSRNSLANLSLRPLADALGVTHGTLLYHFGSKEELIMEIIRSGRERQQAMTEQVDDIVGLWKQWSSPSWLPLTRLFFEVYALALQDSDRFPNFLESAVNDWLVAITPKRTRKARARATLELAVFRGLLLDLCASGDLTRTTDAVESFAALMNGV